MVWPILVIQVEDGTDKLLTKTNLSPQAGLRDETRQPGYRFPPEYENARGAVIPAGIAGRATE